MKKIFLLVLLLLFCVTDIDAKTYYTTFPLTENPISEGSKWSNAAGAAEIKTVGGNAVGIDDSGYDDAVAFLTGVTGWSNDQSVQVTVYNPTPSTVNCAYEEVELHLRGSTVAVPACDNAACRHKSYEVVWNTSNSLCDGDQIYWIDIVRWNGSISGEAGIDGDNHLDGFTILANSNSVANKVNNGDVLKATIVGQTISAYKKAAGTTNWVLQLQVTDNHANKITSGVPGFGHDGPATGGQDQYGASDFFAWDSNAYKLSVTKSGTGTGTVQSSPSGITCTTGTCDWYFDLSSQVTLEATAGSGSTFTGWSGGGCSGTGNCTVTMSGAVTVTATFVAATGCTGSSPTWTAASAALADVKACVAVASSGDTINIPAGTKTWTETVQTRNNTANLFVTKGITLKGAGIGNTVITAGAATSMILYTPSNFTANDPLRITGIEFNLNNLATAIFLRHEPCSSGGTVFPMQTKIRIDHNKIYGKPSGRNSIRVLGMMGVIDNNIITSTTSPGSISFYNDCGDYGKSWWENWAGVIFGADQNTMYMEDNVITVTGCSTSSQYANRWSARYNDITTNTLEGGFLMEYHPTAGPSSMYATFGGEVYGNNVTVVHGLDELVEQRGGHALIHHNLANTGSSVRVYSDAWDCYNPISETFAQCAARPGPVGKIQHVNDSYYWANRKTAAGTLTNVYYMGTWCSTGTARNIACTLATHGYTGLENEGYWQDKVPFTGAAGVGCGTLAARPATCTKGVAYWATDQATCTDLTGYVGASTAVTGGTRDPAKVITGTLYKCTATNTWSSYATPLTYPHPLRNEGTPAPDLTPPTQPTNLTATALSYPTINLSWTASTDAVGVTGYKIMRCTGAGCTPTVQISITTAVTYQDANLSNSTVYGYRIVAYDAAGNNSVASTAAYATTPAADVNIALNKTATASTEYQNYAGCGGTHCLASYVTDGLLTTRWASFYADPQWIKVDLGANYAVNRVLLRWYTNFAKDYTLEYSTDDITYTVAATVTGGDGGVDTHTISPAVTARYLKLNSTARYNTSSNSLWEFEAYGTASTNYLEFENAAVCTLAAPMVSTADENASGGYYVHTTLANSGTATCAFTVAAAGYYKIVARVYAPTTASDSLTVQVDALGADIYDLNSGGDSSYLGVWFEDEVSLRGTGTVSDQYDPYVFYLAAGAHSVVFTGREVSGTNSPRLDYFRIVPVTVVEQFALTYTKAGVGVGTVVINGVNCFDSCVYNFNPGTPITITGVAGGDSVFAGWSGGLCTGTDACTFNMTEARAVTGTFNLLPPYNTLTITKDGTGLGTVTSSPVGISCGATCTYDFTDELVVRLTATPTAGNTFTGWFGDGGCTGTSYYDVTMDAARACTATFTLSGSSTGARQTWGKVSVPVGSVQKWNTGAKHFWD